MTNKSSDDNSFKSPAEKKRKLTDHEEDEKISESEWSEDKMSLLLEKISEKIEKKDSGKHYRTFSNDLNWESFKVASFTGEECKQRWNDMLQQVRKFRTISEVIEDAKKVTKTFRDTGRPKRPLSAIIMYMNKHKNSFKQENPQMNNREIQKALCQQFHQLSDKKKKKYQKKYEKELEEFRKVYGEYMSTHKKHKPEEKNTGNKNLKKPTFATPKKLYVQEMLLKHTQEDTHKKKEAREMYENKWNELDESRKVKFINEADKIYQQYKVDIKMYNEKKNVSNESIKESILTKAERLIKDKFDGKPPPPPVNSYVLYSRSMLSQSTGKTSFESLHELSRKWKNLPENEKDQWKQKYLCVLDEYGEKLEKYVDGLPEEEKGKYEEELKRIKKKTKIKVIKEEAASKDLLPEFDSMEED